MRWLALLLALVVSPLASVPVPPYRPKPVVKAPSHTDHECLANAIHYEAGSEPLEGQRAVYEVIMHRAKAQRMGVCAVVKAPSQFSWVGLKPFKPLTQQMQTLLTRVKNHPKVLEGISVRWFFSGTPPKWATTMDCRVIGSHNFCKQGDKNNGSTGEVRDQGASPQEEPQRGEQGHLQDV